ncbi:hypothetical protein [Bacteroides sp. 224]|uniref:hypothetical protein n=1 Tax=Bacteroides sp. 224 TaxID=2302936 RepID=UPI0013D07F46|nr:hypothetical protein [Bacteroides sp. 224]NDV66660.1 hypothetical protein [Bacteroides sp. 224]
MKELFAKCISHDSGIKGRIGGNPPQSIGEQIPDEYMFYATLVHPEKENIMLTILIHNNFETLIENNIYPSIAVKVIEHKYSEMGSNIHKAITNLPVNSISDYKEIQDNDFQFIKVGGEPRFIQYKDYYYEELERNGYSFFLQIDEEGYRQDMEYVFMYGALYLYKHNVTGKIIAGFWQYS